ncbi:hypothetical protein [Phenylobacterium sp.]|uniref:hypothetical protein n=1 Tax=Phenylobacterium sp. TaxID=1871053 RepID=UPI003D2CECB9
MSTEAARNARELQMLEGLVDCAYGLAKTLAAAGQAEPDTRHSLQLVEGFTKCTFALRMGIRLCRTLRAPPKAAPALVQERAETPEREPAEHEPVERGERPELERERDRDYEPVSLPKFLSTLGVVARDAARLEDRLPPDAARLLPTLEGLLAEAKSEPLSPEPSPSRPTGVAVLARPPQTATRHKLLGSAAPPRPGPRAPPPWPNSG